MVIGDSFDVSFSQLTVFWSLEVEMVFLFADLIWKSRWNHSTLYSDISNNSLSDPVKMFFSGTVMIARAHTHTHFFIFFEEWQTTISKIEQQYFYLLLYPSDIFSAAIAYMCSLEVRLWYTVTSLIQKLITFTTDGNYNLMILPNPESRILNCPKSPSLPAFIDSVGMSIRWCIKWNYS